MIDVLKHITIVVLQDVQSEIKTEAEECQDVDIKHEQNVTQEFVSCVKIEKQVKEANTVDFYCLLFFSFIFNLRDLSSKYPTFDREKYIIYGMGLGPFKVDSLRLHTLSPLILLLLSNGWMLA